MLILSSRAQRGGERALLGHRPYPAGAVGGAAWPGSMMLPESFEYLGVGSSTQLTGNESEIPSGNNTAPFVKWTVYDTVTPPLSSS